jgi:hypothetical protein
VKAKPGERACPSLPLLASSENQSGSPSLRSAGQGKALDQKSSVAKVRVLYTEKGGLGGKGLSPQNRDESMRQTFEKLLVVEEDSRFSPLQLFKKPKDVG